VRLSVKADPVIVERFRVKEALYPLVTVAGLALNARAPST